MPDQFPEHHHTDATQLQMKRRRGIFWLVLILAGSLLSGSGYLGYMQYSGQKKIEDWATNYPVNAMVLAKHSDVFPRMIAHFRPYTGANGQPDLPRGQLELQQIINVNYLTDYIWQVKDVELRDYITRQYMLIATLVSKSSGQKGVCEQYFGDSSFYDQVEKLAGGTYFSDYMKSSEALILSARDGQTYITSPENTNYNEMTNSANWKFWQKFRSLHPGESDSQLQTAVRNFNPLVSCAGYADYLKALLELPDRSMSVQWRAGLEHDRPMSEALRRQRGSE